MTNQTLQDFKIRHPQAEDAEAIAGVMIALDMVQQGFSDITTEDIISSWERPGLDPQEDAWIILAPGDSDTVVGYAELWNRADHARLNADGYVHPHYQGLGIGTSLLKLMETRAQEHAALAPADREVAIYNAIHGSDKGAIDLHESRGFHPERYFWRMEIKMDEAPPAPVWPEGMQVRTYSDEIGPRAVIDAIEDAFKDHWGYTPWDYEYYRHRMFEQEDFDPSLYLLAFDGDQIAGGVLCTNRQETGWVNQLAVRRPWRRKGLGLALLYWAFGEFYRRGTRTVGLGVDASNPTGATRLYKKAGMHVAFEYVVYKKILRESSNGNDHA